MILANAQFLEWDSQWFGIPIGRVDIPELTRNVAEDVTGWAVSQGVKCVYVHAQYPTSELFDGFDFMDTRIEYSFNIDTDMLCLSSSHKVEPLRLDELESVCALCRQHLFRTRFIKDPRFQADRASELYAEWVRFDFAKATPGCIVLRNEHRVVGFATGRVDGSSSGTGKIGLLGVADGYRGAGVGGTLLDGILYKFAEIGVDRVTVVTQDENLAASRLYKSRGGSLLSKTYWYHLWL